MTRLLLIVIALLLGVVGTAVADLAVPSAQAVFFHRLKSLRGHSFEGKTTFPQDPAHEMVGKRLVLTFSKGPADELRVPFAVGDDKSRTWVLKMTADGLQLKHDHRMPDGTADPQNLYGGTALGGGLGLLQIFPADEHTRKIIPEAASNVWSLRLSFDEKSLIYYLERHRQPRYEAVFDLTKPTAFRGRLNRLSRLQGGNDATFVVRGRGRQR